MKFRALIPLFLGVALPVSGQEPAPPAGDGAPLKVDPSRDLYDLATINYGDARDEKDPKKKERDFRSAAKTFTQFLRKFPADAKALDAWYFLGMSYRQIGEEKASRTCFETVATKWQKGKYVEASALFLASDDYKAGKWSDAAKWFQIVADTTEDPQIKHQSLYRRFLCFHKLDSNSGRLLSLKAVLANEGSPYEETARLALARLYRDSKSTREAHAQFVLLAKSKDAKIRDEAILQAALTAQTLGDQDLTKTWFKNVLTSSQSKEIKGQTQLALMNLHYKEKDWQGVIDIFRLGTFTLEKEAQLQRLIMAAKSYDALGKKDEVNQLYEEISKLSPGSASSFEAAYRVLVRDHQNKDRNFAASAETFLKSYGEAKAKDAKTHSIRLLLAEHYFNAKNYQKAIDQYRLLDLTMVDSSNALGVRYHVAKSQLALKNEKGALAAITAFIAEFPNAKQSMQLRLDRAELFNEKGQEAEAVGDYEAILQSSSDQKLKRILILRLAAIYKEQKAWQKFAAMQEKLLLMPDLDQKTQASANYWLGWNELQLKNSAKAETFLRKARSLDPKTYTPTVGPLLIKSAYKSGDLELLEKEINLVSKESPETKLPSAILQWLGATLSKQGQHERAWPILQEGLQDKEAPGSALSWKLFSTSSLALKRYPDALRAAETVLAMEENAYRKAEALHLKGQAHIGLKQFDDARQAISDALDLRPQGELDIRLRIFAGDIDIAEGKPGDAIRHYIVVESTFAKTDEEKKEVLAKIISTLKAIGTPKALELLKDYEK